MKTYTTKSGAKKGAKRENLDADALLYLQDPEGRWYWFAHEGGQVDVPAKTDELTLDDADEAIAVPEDEDEPYKVGDHTHCPGCGVGLDNGVADNFDDYHQVREGHMQVPNKAEWMASAEAETTHTYTCLACGEQFGRPLKLGGLKIEKNRPEQNGIIRPSEGGKCRQIWDACDAIAAAGSTPMPKLIKAVAANNGWNENNAVIEMYQWRKFHGIAGRQG